MSNQRDLEVGPNYPLHKLLTEGSPWVMYSPPGTGPQRDRAPKAETRQLFTAARFALSLSVCSSSPMRCRLLRRRGLA